MNWLLLLFLFCWHFLGFPTLLGRHDQILLHLQHNLQEQLIDVTTRSLWYLLWKEVWMGCLLIVPICTVLAQGIGRWSAKISNLHIKTAVTAVIFEIFLEVFMSSLQCVPESNHSFSKSSTALSLQWFQRSWGLGLCHDNQQTHQNSLAKHSEMILVTLRLIFVTTGLYVGQSFLPVALTGSIATGKSTVAQMLLTTSSSSSSSSSTRQQEQKNNHSNESDEKHKNHWFHFLNKLFWSKRKGTFMMVDTDRLGHEILLPPSMLQNPDHPNQYSITSKDSVYYQILNTFGDENTNHQNILDEKGMIERRKLGAIIFADPIQRRKLNRICHPKIIMVMFQQLLYGSLCGVQDIVCADVPLLFESGKLKWLFALSIVVACDSDLQYQRLRSRNPDLSEKECRDRIQSQMSMDQKIRSADFVLWNNASLDDLFDQVENVRKEIVGRVCGIHIAQSFFLLVGGTLLLHYCGVSV